MSTPFPGLTVDGPTTKDMDDSIWVEPVDGGLKVTVCVADVADKVLKGSVTDLHALEKTATKYFATGNSPMLPRDLSEDKLSLRPNEFRRVMAVVLTVGSETLEVREMRVARGTLKSRARLIYEDIPTILDDPRHPFHAMLKAASNLSLALLEQRRLDGAMAMYDLNNGWVTTEDGDIRQIKDHRQTIGHILVQELMILANVAVANYAIKHNIPLLFRNHSARMDEETRQGFLELLEEATHHALPDLAELRKTMHHLLDRAVYGNRPEGHFGLNLPAYLHFTSPIRRYADLVCHRQIQAHLAGEPYPYDPVTLKVIAHHINTVAREERDERSQVMKGYAEKKVNAAIESRRLDGLNANDFERATKVQAEKEVPDPAFVEAFVRRVGEDRHPLIALTSVLTRAPKNEPWKPIREAVLAAVVRRPPDAISVLTQGPAVTVGWEPVQINCGQRDKPQKHFYALAVWPRPAGEDETTMAEATASTKKRAEQWAAVRMVARLLDLTPPEMPPETMKEPPKPVASPTGPVEDPVSALMTHSQRSREAAPEYSFTSSGPPHSPVITCQVVYRGITLVESAKSKQEAKKKASATLLAALG